MKQPELGNKISELRNQKGITQKELSELCNVDIRTIQRIEGGEVTPRMSTLKLITRPLSGDEDIFKENINDIPENYQNIPILLFFITGLMFFISWIFFSRLITIKSFMFSFDLLIAIIYTITGVIFYYGFYILGKSRNNIVIKVSSIIIMICIPFLLISILLKTEYWFAKHLNQLIILIMALNSIPFGIGIMKLRNHILNKIAGILQFLICPFFIIPVPVFNVIGCWLSLPFMVLILIIMFLEYRNSQSLLPVEED